MTDRDPAVDPAPAPRRREWAFGLVVLGVVVALSFVTAYRFRVGSGVLALSFGGATALRAVLPERQAGMLVVRSRAFDVLVLGALSGGLAVLTLLVPPGQE